MLDILYAAYPWIKAGHIIAVISWMAGIFYLPRLFVHHVENVGSGTDTDSLFKMMEEKLLRVIMTPAMIATWIFGLLMAMIPGVIDWSMIWPWLKFSCVIAMTVFHMWLASRRRLIAAGENVMSGRTYRIMNEVPTVLMFIIVIMVIVRPF